MSLTKVSSAVLNIDDLYGFRNRIINGDMRIDQRNAGALVAGAVGNTFGVDRFFFGVFGSGTGRISTQQTSVVPSGAGFVNSVVGTVTTADATPSATFGYCLMQRIEGFNVADLGFGTAGASAVTVSFWVRNSLAGTYVVTLSNQGVSRAYSTTYTVSSANTWELKTVTIPGDTSGTWNTGNGQGLQLTWGLGGGTSRQANALNAWSFGTDSFVVTDAAGCVDWIATSGATFYVTGVQLEKGTVATPFERRPFGTELALCQRYAYQMNAADSNGANRFSLGFANSTTKAYVQTQHPVPMRIKPSLTTTAATLVLSDTLAGTVLSGISIQSVTSDVNKTSFDCTVASGLTAFRPYYMEGLNSSATLLLSAEL
jgi:hypothetical protein